ncbi:hypothetical protein P4161_09940 [Pseudomonas aeruginosa]|nr:hypothetical protein [Pseudomonas aeruginosa]
MRLLGTLAARLLPGAIREECGCLSFWGIFAMSRTTRWKDVRKCGIRTLVPLGVSLSLSPCALAEARSSGWEQDFIGVPVARALGLTGKGVDVGVIDGGFLPQHPAFAGQAITPLANRVAIDGEEAIADPPGRSSIAMSKAEKSRSPAMARMSAESSRPGRRSLPISPIVVAWRRRSGFSRRKSGPATKPMTRMPT